MTVFFLQNPAISRESQNDNGGQQAYNRFFTRSTLPPPRLSGLRFPTPVSHGRDLASRPGCTVPGEGVGSPCLRLRLRPASPTPGERGTMFLPFHRQPAAARHRSRLSLSASGSSVSNQAGLLQTNIAAISIGVNRLPSSFALLGRGFTMPAVCANACHRPSIHRGSRLGFYRPQSLP